MRDHSPVPVQRVLALRQYPGFADADLAELAVLADNVVENHLTAGAFVTRPGRVPAIHLVLEGRIEMAGRSWGPRELVGPIEAMAGRPVTAPMIATVETRTLSVGAAEFADILEDNFGLLSNVWRAVARLLLAAQQRRTAPSPRRPATPQLAVSAAGSLGLVDRLLALRRQTPFAHGKIQALSALAQAAHEQHWPAGASLTRAGDAATSSLIILEGAVRLTRSGRVLVPGDTLGTVESLAEALHDDTAEALTEVRALACPAAAMFDVIEDHTDLGLATIASLASELLDELARPAVPDDEPDRDRIN